MPRRFAPILLTALILSSGCSAGHYGVEPTDLSAIQIGATKSQVNEALGPPVKSQMLDGEQVSIYEYNKGRPQRWATGSYGFVGPAFPIVLIGQAVADRDFVAEQRGHLFVAFGSDGRVKSVETQEEVQSHQQREQRALITRLELEKAAAEDDFAAVFGLVDIGSGLQEEERTRWTCIAAHHEYAPAQKRMGTLFWYGIGGLPEDKAQGFKWYNLAADNGLVIAERLTTEKHAQLTPAERNMARTLLKEWQPNPQRCDVLSPEAANLDRSTGN